MQVDEIIEQVFLSVQQTEIGPSVLELLAPDGKPHCFENSLWDFKRKPPTLLGKSDGEARDRYQHEIHELIKDIVSFHNSYGGYLVFGVEDNGADRITGCEAELDLGDLSKRIKAHTGSNLELYQNSLTLGSWKVLLLLVTRRRSEEKPLQFIKAAPLWGKKRAYSKGSVYVRIKDECRPANNDADDWKFLFSGRRKTSITQPPKPKENTPSNLPPRDPDMVHFVGREEELCVLRSWILDSRNPIKLISGIGGLGKTSVAYRFCEELTSTGAGDFDYLAWVSAKKSTFAALRGKMVKTTRHDFSTIEELLKKLISLIAGESSVNHNLEQDEYVEILTDALIYRPSFIVVDDLDSLAPDDQRECTTILQEIAFRTVDRDHMASKVLLTSRLDQGLPPTAVIKITGLGLDEFKEHIENLCSQFGLAKFKLALIKDIHQSASGSPLFASAIVRLASLGENPKEICTTWASKDGEDVREFAFKRELDRLSRISASVLLAVVNLGEVSIGELLEVVEISKKSLLDRINEIQSYHLLSKAENRNGEHVFTTSKELVSAAGILRKKLGQKSNEVERRCAVIRKNQGDQTKEIGRRIREIVNCWDEGRHDEALVFAKDLAKRNSKNGDVWCALAGAHLKVKPEQFSNADAAASKAVDLACSRLELFDYFVLAKQGTEDWQGLKNYTENKRYKSSKRDPVLDAYLVAVSHLGNLASARGNSKDASSYAMDGVKRISEKIAGSGLDPSFFERLILEQNRLAKAAIDHRWRSIQSVRDHLAISDLGFKLVDLSVLTREVITAICEGLQKWSEALKKSSFVDNAALDILANNVRKLDRLKGTLMRCKRDVQYDLKIVDQVQKHLGFIGASL